MLRLRLFGAPTIERDGTALTGRATHRHRLALLALLALAPGRRLSRDKLIATLWPESDTERGRNLLKVATYVLRSELGEEVLVSTGDELRMDTTHLDVDVVAFQQAMEQGEHERACTLYRAPLLDGFFLDGSPEFEQWVHGQRDALEAQQRRALGALAEEAEERGDWPAAVDRWKELAGRDPYDSRVALRLMQALDAAGNRAGALQHATLHERMLQEEFGVAGAPDVAALAERLRNAVPAPNAAVASATPVTDVSAPTSEAWLPAAVPSHAAAAPGDERPRRRRWLVAAFIAAPLLAAGGLWVFWPRPATTTSSIVVLPFVNMTADEDYGYFSDGLTEEIITRLAAIPGLKVISRTSAMQYRGTTTPLPTIADELGVDHVLEGSVRRAEGRVRISAQLVDARDDNHLWAENYEYETGDEFRVQEQIAHEVAQALELRLAPQVQRLLVRPGTDDPEAYELYERGRFLWNTRTRDGHERAIDYYWAAIAQDSAYADAYAALAHAYITGFQLDLLGMSDAEAYDRVKWATERALALDDESADAHVGLAIALLWQRNWPGAEREYLRAIELNPGHATARTWYALLLRGMNRHVDALHQARLAVELDPFGVITTHNYGWQCYIAGDMECAIEQLERSVNLGFYPGAARSLGIAYARSGRFADAFQAVEKAMSLAPHRTDFIGDLAYVHALAGDTARALELLDSAKVRPLEPFTVARAYAALGQTDSAFTWLERSTLHWPNRAALGDPGLAPLRPDPRFAQIENRVRREMGLQ